MKALLSRCRVARCYLAEMAVIAINIKSEIEVKESYDNSVRPLPFVEEAESVVNCAGSRLSLSAPLSYPRERIRCLSGLTSSRSF